MLPFLSLHALAAQRGDGLRPELKALFERHAGVETGLSATIDPVEITTFYIATRITGDERLDACSGDGSCEKV